MSSAEKLKLYLDMIYMLANAEDGMSTNEIAKMFGVSQRKIQTDIKVLEDAGIPLYQDG